jgi:flagellar basal-body rod modification protein FlgD
MSISTITPSGGSNLATAAGAAVAGASSGNTAGSSSAAQIQNQFLTLLVAQMKNQDPMNPMDSSQMTSQLAQISSVQGIQNLNTSITSLLGQMGSLQTLDSTNLVGHTALVNGSTLELSNGSPTGGGYQLPSNVDGGAITIRNASGLVVAQLPLTGTGAGLSVFAWDGTQIDGRQAPAGQYTFSVNATSGGQAVTATPLAAGVVQGVQQNANGQPQINLGSLGVKSLSSVVQMM